MTTEMKVNVKRECKYAGCEKWARKYGLCAGHGGFVTCIKEGCKTAAVNSTHFCARHGGATRCNVEGCNKYKAYGGYCTTHAKIDIDSRTCVVPSCKLLARRGYGHCYMHGGPDQCVVDGCKRRRIRKLRCSKHMSKEDCYKYKEAKLKWVRKKKLNDITQ